MTKRLLNLSGLWWVPVLSTPLFFLYGKYVFSPHLGIATHMGIYGCLSFIGPLTCFELLSLLWILGLVALVPGAESGPAGVGKVMLKATQATALAFLVLYALIGLAAYLGMVLWTLHGPVKWVPPRYYARWYSFHIGLALPLLVLSCVSRLTRPDNSSERRDYTAFLLALVAIYYSFSSFELLFFWGVLVLFCASSAILLRVPAPKENLRALGDPI